MSQVRGDTVVVLSVRFYEERCRETWAGKQPPCASWHAVRLNTGGLLTFTTNAPGMCSLGKDWRRFWVSLGRVILLPHPCTTRALLSIS